LVTDWFGQPGYELSAAKVLRQGCLLQLPRTGQTTLLSPVSIQRLSQDIRRTTSARWVFTHLNRPPDGMHKVLEVLKPGRYNGEPTSAMIKTVSNANNIDLQTNRMTRLRSANSGKRGGGSSRRYSRSLVITLGAGH